MTVDRTAFTTRKPLRRTPIRREKARVPQDDARIFEIVTEAGDRYLWPVQWMPEEGKDGWRATVEGWALLGDPATRYWHCRQTKQSDPGWFDLAILQPTRGKAFLRELKVRDRKGEASSQPSKVQQDYLYAAVHSGLDAATWYWPDDGRTAFETLTDYSYDAYKLGRMEVRR